MTLKDLIPPDTACKIICCNNNQIYVVIINAPDSPHTFNDFILTPKQRIDITDPCTVVNSWLYLTVVVDE